MSESLKEVVKAWLDGAAVQSRREDSGWDDKRAFDTAVNVVFIEGVEYRIKPRTIRIGEYDVPEPVREPLEEGTMFYIPDVMFIKQPDVHVWVDTAYNRKVLLLGLIHLTSEAAELHAKALISFTEVKP